MIYTVEFQLQFQQKGGEAPLSSLDNGYGQWDHGLFLCYLKDLVWGEHYLGGGNLKALSKINGKQQIPIGSGEK